MTREIFLRPWGYYDILHSEPGVQIKRIFVEGGKRLSLQTHEHRAEHWYITNGIGIVTAGDQEFRLGVGDSVTIAIGEQHRIEGFGDAGVTFIEVQTGDYLGEDDIIRIEDDFGRSSTD